MTAPADAATAGVSTAPGRPAQQGRTTLDLVQEVVDPQSAPELMLADIVDAFGSLVSALAWADDNPNRSEYLRSLLDMHSECDNPVLAAIGTAASWLQEVL